VSHFLIDSVSLTPEQKLTVTSEFLNNIRTGMIFRDVQGVVIDCNRAAETILGRSRDVLLGTTTPQFEGRAIHLDGTPLFFDHTWVTKALKSNRPGAIVAGFEVPDRICRWLSIRFWPAVVDGQVVGLMTAFEDVTRKVNGDRFLNLLNRVKDTTDLGASEEDLLQTICDAIVEEGHYSLAWIGVTSSEGGVDILCSSGATDYLVSGMVTWWGSSEAGLGPMGTALRTSTTQVANDLLTQPFFGPWRERAEEFGLSAMISMPLQLGSRRAALSIYDEHAQAFD
jgi:PAS domain S-box-containing protein